MKANRKLHKNFVDIYNWKVTPREFAQWVEDNDLLVSAVQDGSDGWVFVNDEDFLAFTLKFSPRKNLKGSVTELDTAYYYAPYIPLIKCPSSSSDSTT